MEGHAQKCGERYCELANQKTEQLYKFPTPCLDDHHLRKEELEKVGDCSKVCSPIVLKCLHLARMGEPDILWSVSELARAVTKRTRARDERCARLTSYTHNTSDQRQHWYVGIQRSIAEWDYSKTQTLLGTLKVRNKPRVNSMYIWKTNIRSHKLNV